MTAKPPRLRSRDFDPSARKRLIELLLENLELAERKTDLRCGANPKGKNHEAISALAHAGELVELVAGWALDHVYGLSLQEVKLNPTRSVSISNDPFHIEERIMADEHFNEEIGRNRLDDESIYIAQKRMILRNISLLNLGSLPGFLRDEVVLSLDDLTHGHTPSLLKAEKKGKKAGLKLLEIELKSICIARFWGKLHSNIGRSFNEVAVAFSVSAETLLSWEKRLREHVGRLNVSQSLAQAESAAHIVAEINERERSGEKIDYLEDQTRQTIQRHYGNKALAMLVEQYRRLKTEAE